MDFTLTIEQRDAQERARALTRSSLADRAADYDRDAAFPRENLDDLHDAGLLKLLVPTKLGGDGADLTTYVSVVTEIAQGCGSTALVYAMHCGATGLACGGDSPSDTQRQWADEVVKEGRLFAWGFSEPGIGGNILTPQLSATHDETGFTLNGTKSFVSASGHVDHYLINAHSGEQDFSRSQTLVVVDPGTRGFAVKETWDGMGMRGNAAHTLTFDGVQVPATASIGGHGGGLPLLMTSVAPLILGLAATSLGIARAAADFARRHVSRRRVQPSNLTLADLQAVRMRIAEIETLLHHSWLTLMYGAWIADRDLLEALPAMNLAKYTCNSAAITIADHAMQLCGANGYQRSNPLERHHRDARAGAVMGANLDVLKDMIAKSALGLDPR
jgi:alkylation response protein AidB-like acyl-CoA dehydrogenase